MIQEKSTFSGSAIANVVLDSDARLELRDAARKAIGEDAFNGVLQAVGDQGSASFGKYGDGKSGAAAIAEITRRVATNGEQAYQQMQNLRDRGVTISYVTGDSYKAQQVQGNNVLAIVDPPYYATKGYNGINMVPIETYNETRKLLDTLKAAGNSVIYTDEAWWEKHDKGTGQTVVPKDASQQVNGLDAFGQLKSIQATMGEFFRTPIATRMEVIGFLDGNQNAAKNAGIVGRTQGAGDRQTERGGKAKVDARGVDSGPGQRTNSNLAAGDAGVSTAVPAGLSGRVNFSRDAAQPVEQKDALFSSRDKPNLFRAPEVRNAAGQLLAPNGQPSVLSEGQWHQVRSPAFKAWFGDWQAADLQARILTTTQTDTTARNLEVEGTYKDLRRQATASYLGRTEVRNRATGESIKIAKSGIENALQHGMNLQKRAVVSVLDSLIERAAFIAQDTQDMRQGVRAVETYASRVSVDGEAFVARIEVRELADGKRFYDHELTELRKSERLAGNSGESPRSFSERSSEPRPTASLGRIVLDQALLVNPATISKVTNPSTGEPLVVYHAAVLDLHSRKIVGWAMSPAMHAGLVCAALQMVVVQRNPAAKLIVHSDRGTQYASAEHQAVLSKHEFVGSMSRKGNCWADLGFCHNAVMERFFLNLKMERVWQKHYANHAEASNDIADYIVGFYNAVRLHLKLGTMSANAFDPGSRNLGRESACLFLFFGAFAAYARQRVATLR